MYLSHSLIVTSRTNTYILLRQKLKEKNYQYNSIFNFFLDKFLYWPSLRVLLCSKRQCFRSIRVCDGKHRIKLKRIRSQRPVNCFVLPKTISEYVLWVFLVYKSLVFFLHKFFCWSYNWNLFNSQSNYVIFTCFMLTMHRYRPGLTIKIYGAVAQGDVLRDVE